MGEHSLATQITDTSRQGYELVIILPCMGADYTNSFAKIAQKLLTGLLVKLSL